MINDSIIASLISFFVCIIICPYFIPILHKLKFGQQVRTDGPSAHLKKSGTPTMGGIMIIIAIVIASLPYILKYKKIIPVLLITIAFALIGFLDDYLKVVKKQSEGLKARQKFILQILCSLAFAIYVYYSRDIRNDILIPFTGNFKNGILLNLGILSIPFSILVILGTDNGVNFTDGVDGLCSGVSAVVALFFVLISVKENIELAPINGAVFGSLLGFLVFNCHPAKVFMGDTGSLALGAYVASVAIVSGLQIFIVIVGLIYVIEVLSVIIQVGYFKKTGGKRIFRMAPIHHHFELGGWSETKVFTIFTIVTIILCLVSLLGTNI